jgi:hypothetical protein
VTVSAELASLALSVEELRGGLAGITAVALAAGDDRDAHRAAAVVAFGLNPRTEPSTPGAVVGRTACSWCGRTDPEGGLTQDYPRPPAPEPATDISTGRQLTAPVRPAHVDNRDDMHCRDEAACQSAREAALPGWVDHQFPAWRAKWARYRRAEEAQKAVAAYQRERQEAGRRELEWQRSHAWGAYHADQLAAWEQQVTPEFTAALSMVRDMVEAKASGYLELSGPEPVELSAPAPEPEPPKLARLCADRECTHHTMRCPDNRTHTLGHLRSLNGVSDAAAALGRRNVLARSG